MTRAAALRQTFLDLHHSALREQRPLVMPNPWDIGSARLLVTCGSTALATTSAGHAASQGRLDQNVDRDELVAHAAELAECVEVPLNVDSEDCFADDIDGICETATMIAATDAAGFSIEDYNPRTESIRNIDESTQRVAAVKQAGGDLVLTARAENLLYGAGELDDTIARLVAYRDAGADVVYAPGLFTADDIARVVAAVDAPVNVLALPGTPTVAELGQLGVARVSVGSLFANAAYGALVRAAQELLGPGTSDYVNGALDGATARAAFNSR